MDSFDPLVDYLQLGDVARGMRDGLAYRMVAPSASLPEAIQRTFGHALSQLSTIREGFVVSLRTSDTSHPSELRKLVQAILFEWQKVEVEFGFALLPPDQVELPRTQLLAFAHSYVTFGVIPQLPPDEVTFPQRRRTYADIHAPRSAGEVLERIEEMEAVVSEAESEPLERIDRSRLRRTYGFFEASAWLVTTHAARFAKRKR